MPGQLSIPGRELFLVISMICVAGLASGFLLFGLLTGESWLSLAGAGGTVLGASLSVAALLLGNKKRTGE